jgi:hypothetical protein
MPLHANGPNSATASRNPSGHMETGYEVRGQQDHHRIDHKKKQSQGDDGDGEGNNLQNQSQRYISSEEFRGIPGRTA